MAPSVQALSSRVAQTVIAIALVAFALGTPDRVLAQQPRVLKISHQFPASTGTEGDFRDQLARKFAADVEKRTNGALKVEVYPASSLVKTFAQFGAMRKGALDMSVLPIAYGGGEVPEANLGLMPALITSYEQGLRWKDAPIGKEWSKLLEDRGIKIVTWVWQAGGIAEPREAGRLARRREGNEDPRRQQGDGHDAEGRGRRDHQRAVERDLQRDAVAACSTRRSPRRRR